MPWADILCPFGAKNSGARTTAFQLTNERLFMPEVIDAHQHFWQLDQPFEYGWLETPGLEPIRRDFLPEDLAKLIGKVGVDRTVFVQTQHNIEENRWVLGLAEQCDFIAGVVGWVDLAGDKCETQLLEFKDHPKFVGIRHVTQDEPDDDFIIRPDVVRGLRVLEKHGVPFDLLFYVKHLKHAAPLAKMLPDLPMVINHLAKPQIKDGISDGWRRELQSAAQHPNVYCKLSGMVTEADWKQWTPTDLRPFVETALEAFGPARCMFGSDWPVCELAGSYQQVYNALREIVGELGASELEQIFGGTAARFYGLSAVD
jgi:L-fuconolactonase